MEVFLDGLGLFAPGFPGWSASRELLAGSTPGVALQRQLLASTLLPANERRRAPKIVHLALTVGMEALATAERDPSDIPTIFASSGGEGDTIHDIMTTLASPQRALSPIRFHNSVHNVSAGYWSIATSSRAANTSLCCHDGSFAAGLLETASQAICYGTALLIAYDAPYPSPLNEVRTIRAPLFGVAMVLSSSPSKVSLARLQITSELEEAVSSCSNPMLEALRGSIPAARCLPLLAALANDDNTSVVLEYLTELALKVDITFTARGVG